MQVIWEADDVRPGRVVCGDPKSERSVIGYRYHGAEGRQVYTLNSLRDGMVTDIGTSLEEAARVLNERARKPAEMFESESVFSATVLKRT